jgi:hypothetical protein
MKKHKVGNEHPVADAQPQAPNQMGHLVEVNVDENLPIHYLLPRWGLGHTPGTNFNSFWQAFFIQRKTNLVRSCAGEFTQPVDHPKRKQDSSVGSHSDSGSPFSSFTRVVREINAR